MYNQSSEATAMANYVSDYIDTVENLPLNIQRKLTQARELDVRFGEFSSEMDGITEALKISTDKKGLIYKLQKVLIDIQLVQDEKIEIISSITEQIDSKARALEQAKLVIAKSATQDNIADTKQFDTQPERSSKRLRKQRVEGGNSYDEIIPKEVYEPTPSRKAKRKKKKGSGSFTRLDDTLISPDEPRYCLCDQVSFGEMVFCEKDGCKREWFHFECVGIKTKPKGKWYCPNCKSDKHNHLKAK